MRPPTRLVSRQSGEVPLLPHCVRAPVFLENIYIKEKDFNCFLLLEIALMSGGHGRTGFCKLDSSFPL